jgi:uncharacterized protein
MPPPFAERHETTIGVASEEGKLGGTSGAAGAGARKECAAEAHSLLFHLIEKPARPDELRRQNSEPQQNRQPSRTRRENHQGSQTQQREANKDLKEPFRLLGSLENHSFVSNLNSNDPVPLPSSLDAPTIHSASHLHANFQIGIASRSHLPRALTLLIMDFRPLGLVRGFPVGPNLEIFSPREGRMELSTVRMQIPEGANLILGQSHFIKTAEDLHEVVVNTVPGAKYAVAFNEASGPCLIRVEANDDELRRAAIANAQSIGAGHLFVLLVRQAYPVNLLSRVRDCFEVCSIYCASANPVEVIVAQTPQGRGVLGVVDGNSPKGIESPEDLKHRREFVRKIGYKF